MIRVLFVCLGNICRSPMAEYILKNEVKSKNLGKHFYIDSAATSSEEIGNPVYYLAKEKLEEEGITVGNRKARKITKEDYEKFDYIIGMEDSNIINIKRIVGEDKNNKIYKLLDFTKNPRDIEDPWYTGRFNNVYDEITEGCKAFLKFLNVK